MFRQRHQPGLRGLSDFTELKGVVVTIAGKLLAHKLYHFCLEWNHWSWMRVVLGGESFSALAEGLQEALGQLGIGPIPVSINSACSRRGSLFDSDYTTHLPAQLYHAHALSPPAPESHSGTGWSQGSTFDGGLYTGVCAGYGCHAGSAFHR